MKQHERIRRPIPERKEPIRGDALAIFGPPESPSRGAGGERVSAGPADTVVRAVELGYRVVDDYIRQGQNAARLMARRAYGPKAMINDVQDIAARLMQYGAEFMDVWMQLMGQAGVGQAATPASAHPPGGAEPRTGVRAGSSSPRVAIAIESPLAVEVTVELDPPGGRSLVVQELQAPSGGPSIAGVAIEGVDPPRLRVRVPPEQPAGTYCGLVLDAETSLPAGTVVLRVLPRRADGEAQR